MIACLIAEAQQKVKFMDLNKELLTYTKADTTQDIRYLYWGNRTT
jgi:hypothetical protein